jgi:ADP-ribose pyrophosphatase
VLERQFRHPVRRGDAEFRPARSTPARRRSKRRGASSSRKSATRRPCFGRSTIHPEVGYSTEFIALFEATGLTHVGARLDEGEFIEVVTMTEDELLARFDAGDMTDGKTIAALFAWLRRR